MIEQERGDQLRKPRSAPRIVITVEGGVVQGIYATESIEALVVDYDDLTDPDAAADELARGVGDVIVTKDWIVGTDEETRVPRGTNARIAAFLGGVQNWMQVPPTRD